MERGGGGGGFCGNETKQPVAGKGAGGIEILVKS